jgi:hypothetical protein
MTQIFAQLEELERRSTTIVMSYSLQDATITESRCVIFQSNILIFYKKNGYEAQNLSFEPLFIATTSFFPIDCDYGGKLTNQNLCEKPYHFF